MSLAFERKKKREREKEREREREKEKEKERERERERETAGRRSNGRRRQKKEVCAVRVVIEWRNKLRKRCSVGSEARRRRTATMAPAGRNRRRSPRALERDTRFISERRKTSSTTMRSSSGGASRGKRDWTVKMTGR